MPSTGRLSRVTGAIAGVESGLRETEVIELSLIVSVGGELKASHHGKVKRLFWGRVSLTTY
ncbi:Uncharacterised protein [Serratia quinivorans]|nr:Uncharacterised protein [Serratia quinivorans]